MELCTDEDGDEFLCHRKERQTKTRVGGDPKDLRKFKPKVWNNKDNKKRCPVEAYKVFQQNRPKEMDRSDAPFFLAINHQRNPSNPSHCWFKNCPQVKNQLYKLVPNMKANCPALSDGRKLTNHSVRKNLLQKCNDMGLAPTATVQISGHKNVQSINSYSKLNEQQQKKISTALISTENNMSNTRIALQNSPPAAAAPHIPYSHHESPTNQSQAITYKRQSAHSQMSTIFQGKTTITGGVFNFYTAERCQSSPQRPKKFRRIMQIDSDSD